MRVSDDVFSGEALGKSYLCTATSLDEAESNYALFGENIAIVQSDDVYNTVFRTLQNVLEDVAVSTGVSFVSAKADIRHLDIFGVYNNGMNSTEYGKFPFISGVGEKGVSDEKTKIVDFCFDPGLSDQLQLQKTYEKLDDEEVVETKVEEVIEEKPSRREIDLSNFVKFDESEKDDFELS